MESPEDPSGSWSRLSEALISGVHHALNNRLAALSAVGQVLEADLPAGHPLCGALTAEIDRMEGAVATLRLLAPGAGEAEPLQLESLVPDLKRLAAIHHDLRDRSLEIHGWAGLHPVWADASDLLRALMMMIASAGVRAAASNGPIRLVATGDERAIRIRVEAEGGAADGDGAKVGSGLQEADPAAVRHLLRPASGTLEVASEPEGWTGTITLPTLAEFRRREREG